MRKILLIFCLMFFLGGCDKDKDRQNEANSDLNNIVKENIAINEGQGDDILDREILEGYYKEVDSSTLNSEFKDVFQESNVIEASELYFMLDLVNCQGSCPYPMIKYYEIEIEDINIEEIFKKLENVIKERSDAGYEIERKNDMLILIDKYDGFGYRDVAIDWFIWQDKKNNKLKIISSNSVSDFDTLIEFIELNKNKYPKEKLIENGDIQQQQIQQKVQ
ncbi:MAG: hypothetical protein GF347_05425 [Candidatus Moranbacteria bacterium]|nr:hypothetical protein [Candidatus Moranbacteria bacterium]